jgi:hypothetical protein
LEVVAMIMPQAMRRSGYDDDPGWLRLSVRVAEETGPVRTYRLRPDEMAQMFPASPGSTAQGGATMRGTRTEPGLRQQAQELSDGGMSSADIARKLRVPYSTAFGWLHAAQRAANGKGHGLVHQSTRKANGALAGNGGEPTAADSAGHPIAAPTSADAPLLSRAEALDLFGLALQSLVLIAPSAEAEQTPAVKLARQVAAVCRRILVPENESRRS